MKSLLLSIFLLGWSGLAVAQHHGASSGSSSSRSGRNDAQFDPGSLEDVTAELNFQTRAAYLRLYEVTCSQDIVQHNLDLFHSLENLAHSQVESGKATLADVLRVRIRQQELETQLQLLENQKMVPLATLNKLRKKNEKTPFEITETLSLAVLDVNRDFLVRQAQMLHVELIILANDYYRTRDELAEEEYNPSNSHSDDHIKNLRERVAATEISQLLITDEFRSYVDQMIVDHENSKLQIALYDQQIKTIRAAIDILRSRYSAQGMGFDELINLLADLSAYEMKKLNAIVDSHLAVAELDRYVLQSFHDVEREDR